MTNTYHGVSALNTLSTMPQFPTIQSGSVPSAIPISAGSMTSLDPKFGMSRWKNSWVYRLFTSEEKFSVMDFWYAADGGVSGFWLPSWISDFTPSASVTAGDTYLSIKTSEFKEYFDSLTAMASDFTDPVAPPVNQWAVMIMEKDRSMHFRGIQSVDAGQINFWDPAGAGMPHNIALSDIVLISLVRYARFTTGEIEVTWLADNSKVDIRVAFSELFFEGVLA